MRCTRECTHISSAAVLVLLGLTATIATPFFPPPSFSVGHVDYPEHVMHRRTGVATDESAYSAMRMSVTYIDSQMGSDVDQTLYVKELMVEAKTYFETTLKVVRASSALLYDTSVWCKRKNANTNCEAYKPITCGPAEVPSEYWNATQTCTSGNSCTTQAAGAGAVAADVQVFVTQVATTACGAGTQAYGGATQYDQNDRPTFGYINFCPGNVVRTNNAADHKMYLNTAIHELTHVMGFDKSRWAYFRDHANGGQPRTGRDADGVPMGGDLIFPGNFTVFKPDSNTMTYDATEQVYKLVTPRALEKAREALGCADLDGVELENQGGDGTIGSHLEMRIFYTENMAGYQYKYAEKSAITLGILEDSGWYYISDAGWCNAEPVTWAGNAGCNFAKDKCIIDNAVTDPTVTIDQKTFPAAHFCTEVDQPKTLKCDYTGTSLGYCTGKKHTGTTEITPTKFQYFEDAETTGGMLSATGDYITDGLTWTDFCPIIRQSDKYRCTDPANIENVPGGSAVNPFVESYTPTSRCFDSTLVTTQSGKTAQGVGCYEWQCDPIGILQIKIGVSWVDCPTNGGKVASPDTTQYSGQVTCPAWSSLCQGKEYTTTCPGGVNTTATPAPPSSCPKATTGQNLECNGKGACPDDIFICYCASGYFGDNCTSFSERLPANQAEFTINMGAVEWGSYAQSQLVESLNALLPEALTSIVSSRKVLNSTSTGTVEEQTVVIVDFGNKLALNSMADRFDFSDSRLHNLKLNSLTTARSLLTMRYGNNRAKDLPENKCASTKTKSVSCCASTGSPSAGGYLMGQSTEMTQQLCMAYGNQSQTDSEWELLTCCVSNMKGGEAPFFEGQGAVSITSTATDLVLQIVLGALGGVVLICIICCCYVYWSYFHLPELERRWPKHKKFAEHEKILNNEVAKVTEAEELKSRKSGRKDVEMMDLNSEHCGIDFGDKKVANDQFGEVLIIKSIKPGSKAHVQQRQLMLGVGDLIFSVGMVRVKDLKLETINSRFTTTKGCLMLQVFTPEPKGTDIHIEVKSSA